MEKVHTENYNLGAHYCRQLREKGGVAIFVHNSLGFINTDIAQHCKEYCKTLSNVIKEAKRIYYNNKIQKSSNTCKTSWDIIKKLANNQHSHTDIQELITDSKHLKDQQDTADAFDYFSTIIDKINKNDVHNKLILKKFLPYIIIWNRITFIQTPIFGY